MAKSKSNLKYTPPNIPSTLDPWTFPPETTLIPEGQYIDLETIDISEIAPASLHDPAVAALHSSTIKRAFNALKTTGFFVVKGHGLTGEQLRHQWALGKLLNCAVPEEEKQSLHAAIDEGSWAGYKPQGYHNRPDGSYDTTEHYDLYPFTAREACLPDAAKPYLSDIRRFIEHNHYHILPRVLALISLGLGLPPDALWNLHHLGGEYEIDDALRGPGNEDVQWRHTKDHLRYVLYHPLREEDRERRRNLRVPGHTDLGSVTFLYSQPIAGLQLLTPNGEWRYIRHYPDQIVVGLRDSMEFISGGIVKAPPHRVKEPPEDQRQLDRLALFYFVPFLPDVPLTPLTHPSIKAQGGNDIFQEYYQLGGKPMTSEEWLVERSKLVGKKREDVDESGARKALVDISFRYNPS